MNNKIKDHLLGNWITYIAALVVIILLWGMVYDAMSKPKANEQVVITLYSSDIDLKAINGKLYNSKDTFTSQALKQVYITTRDKSDDMLNQFIMADLEISDIVVFTEDMLTGEGDDTPTVVPSTLFRFLGKDGSTELLRAVIGDRADSLEYFYDNDINGASRPIGIYLSDNGDESKNIFEGSYKGDERAVAFFTPSSKNVGNMFSDGNGRDTAAIDALLYLLGEE